MSDKENEIKEIAMALFLRHGWTKVTMSDIADSVGISRPTLYKIFSSKEDIFMSIAQDIIDKGKVTASERLKKTKNLETKLQELFNIWIIEPYSSVVLDENSKDFLENCSAYVPEATSKLYEEFETQIREVLEATNKGKNKNQLKDLAHLMAITAKGLKASAPSHRDLKRMVESLIKMGTSFLSR